MTQSTLYRDEKFSRCLFPDTVMKNSQFINCDFSGCDLTDMRFIHCNFYHPETEQGCDFSRATLKEASFKHCDISMCNFRSVNALGIEISECRAQGSDFRDASFMNMITAKSWFAAHLSSKPI